MAIEIVLYIIFLIILVGIFVHMWRMEPTILCDTCGVAYCTRHRDEGREYKYSNRWK